MTLEELKKFIEDEIRECIDGVDFVTENLSAPTAEEVDASGSVVCAHTQTYWGGIYKKEGHWHSGFYNTERQAIVKTMRNFDPLTIQIGQNYGDKVNPKEKVVKLFWRIAPTIEERCPDFFCDDDGNRSGNLRYAIRMRLAVMRISPSIQNPGEVVAEDGKNAA